jgi:hypothetical protein
MRLPGDAGGLGRVYVEAACQLLRGVDEKVLECINVQSPHSPVVQMPSGI